MTKTIKCAILLLCCVFGITTYGKCKKCLDKGFYYEVIECPLCEGYGNVSPGWFSQETGETRWITTTHWTGIQTESDKRHKIFSFIKCPYCSQSTVKGSVKSVIFCDCSAEVSKQQIAVARRKIKNGMSSCKFGKDEMDDMLNGISDTDALRISTEMLSWSARGKILVKLLKCAIHEEFDHESAHYQRNESKYTEKKFKK